MRLLVGKIPRVQLFFCDASCCNLTCNQLEAATLLSDIREGEVDVGFI